VFSPTSAVHPRFAFTTVQKVVAKNTNNYIRSSHLKKTDEAKTAIGNSIAVVR